MNLLTFHIVIISLNAVMVISATILCIYVSYKLHTFKADKNHTKTRQKPDKNHTKTRLPHK